MKLGTKILLFFILPIIAILSFPPSILLKGYSVIAVALVAFVLLGVELLRGHNWALSLTIFIQGVNTIVRMMMFASQSVPENAGPNYAMIVTSIIAIGLSLWLVLRLDKVDVRATIVRP